ncbi:hypothetical protein Cob_v007859 [Colletotrichum orbiculare MAFF 240422]|uniref:Uncharacterized protein n=1 Tax=Colletotrichum orbiculare (strain 104-T / ATCC 96160 / CBS 514.97 / LARS 414 / MAFF 240422) TaxID=1213857 RepID=A0A484FMR5_COLOR|nr:hypothetical protein Cob_v007859 [Colletotrichum orbiculare MAFF 240422]
MRKRAILSPDFSHPGEACDHRHVENRPALASPATKPTTEPELAWEIDRISVRIRWVVGRNTYIKGYQKVDHNFESSQAQLPRHT